MSGDRKQPDWHRMTRDEVDGQAAAMWSSLVEVLAVIDDRTASYHAASLKMDVLRPSIIQVLK